MTKNAIFVVISDQREKLENIFWENDISFLCRYYMPNFSFLSETLLKKWGEGVIHINPTRRASSMQL